MKGDLVKLLKKLISEDSGYRGSPPWQLVQGLEQKRLVISDLEIADEDIHVLVKFFQSKKACQEIESIEINRTCGGSVYRRRKNSALQAHDFLLLKELLQFISKCHHLHMLTLHLVKLSAAFMGALGKALTASTSELRWLVFRGCDVGGDLGVREITPFLCKLPLQVLAFEACKLTDASWRYFASILKARENCLDDLYWNSTLRADPTDSNAEKLSDEDKEVLGDGLVAISLCGNLFAGALAEDFLRVLKKSFWLLGLNLADNKLANGKFLDLLSAIRNNEILQAACLRGNPGSSPAILRELHHVMARKASLPVDQEKAAALTGGYARLDLLPARVAWLLRTWMRLQSEEVVGDMNELTLEDARAYSCLSYCLERAEASGTADALVPTAAAMQGAGATQAEDEDEDGYEEEAEEEVEERKTAREGRPLSSSRLPPRPPSSSLRASAQPAASKHHHGGGRGEEHVLYTPIGHAARGQFHDLLFSNGEAPLELSDIDSTAKGEVGEELARGLPSSQEDVRMEMWEYWPRPQPSETVRSASKDARPPSRASMRPSHQPFHSTGSTTPTPLRRSHSAVESFTHSPATSLPRYMRSKDAPWREARIAAWEDRPPSLRTSQSAEKPRPWVPARVVSPSRTRPSTEESSHKTPQHRLVRSVHSATPLVTAKRQASAPPTYRRSSSSPLKSRKSSSSPPPTSSGREKKTSAGKKKASSASKKDAAMKQEMKALATLSTSVLTATKNLEHVSDRLRSVVKSLSESALVNVSSVLAPSVQPQTSLLSHQTPQLSTGIVGSSLPRNRRYSEETADEEGGMLGTGGSSGGGGGSYHRQGNAFVVPVDFPDSSFQSSTVASTAALKLSTDSDLQLADLVRQRMQTKLRNLLSVELAAM